MLQNIIADIHAEQAAEEQATAAAEKENPQESELDEGNRKQEPAGGEAARALEEYTQSA